MSDIRIGELAEKTGTSAPTIRYYEEIGLLRPASRQAGNQRVYSRDDIDRLTFIRRCREFDFPIEQVRALVGLLDNRSSSCLDARELAAAHLAGVRAKMRELRALERSLAGFVADCDATCAGGPGPDCIILGDLGKRCGCTPGAS